MEMSNAEIKLANAEIKLDNADRHCLIELNGIACVKCITNKHIQRVSMVEVLQDPLRHHFLKCHTCGETLEFHHVDLPNYDTYWQNQRRVDLTRE